MNHDPSSTITVGTNTDNVIQNFQLDSSSLRGRMVRLGSELDDIIKAHNYPPIIQQLLSETLILAISLSSMLKYEGIFTLQIQTDGPTNMLVADITSDGGVRGCASFDEAAIEKLTATHGNDMPVLSEVLGKGHMAFTVDQGPDTERYQGIVALEGESILDSVQHYFNQSEQIGTGIKMSVRQLDDKWRGGLIMLQHMPEDDINPEAGSGNIVEDDWRRTMILLGSCTEDELISPELDSQELLFRLFHEEDLRVFEPKMLHKACRCSRDRLLDAVKMMPRDDIEHIFKGDEANVKCEFCSKEYIIERGEL